LVLRLVSAMPALNANTLSTRNNKAKFDSTILQNWLRLLALAPTMYDPTAHPAAMAMNGDATAAGMNHRGCGRFRIELLDCCGARYGLGFSSIGSERV